MRIYTLLFAIYLILVSCSEKQNIEKIKQDIALTENAFNKMAIEEGIAKAFEHFCAEDGVILRNNKIIKGKKAVYEKYLQNDIYKTASLRWKPDFIDVSMSGDMAYTYGKYIFIHIESTGDTIVNKGIFHTVWKKQIDGSWKFVWD